MNDDNYERELKLLPDHEALLDQLAGLDTLGPFRVVERRHEAQRNAYFDTATGALGAARIAFRRRVIAGERLATWTMKGDGQSAGGVSQRAEIEVQLAADTAPFLALATLRQAARERGAPALAESLAAALASSPPPRAQPLFETETARDVRLLEHPDHGWRLEMAVDRVRLVGHPGFHHAEIELELKRGSEEALDVGRQALESLGPVTPSDLSKLRRAQQHIASHAANDACG